MGRSASSGLLPAFLSVVLLASPVVGQTVTYQLVNGTVGREGRVERYNPMMRKNETICDGFWDLNAADVFCSSQGLGFAVQAQVGPRYGAGTGRIWGAPLCSSNGIEGSLDDCALNTTAGCSHSQDAGVVCSGPLQTGSSKIGFVRIHSNRRSSRYDGLPQIALSGGFAFFCYGSLDQSSAEVTCRSAGYQRAVQYLKEIVTGNAVDLGNLITRANCSGDEVNLKSCSLTIGRGQCKDNAFQHIECEEAAERVPSLASSSDSVRLQGGSVAREGRVEVRRNGTWQSVCAYEWQWIASNQVCSSLKKGYAIAWYTGSLYRGGVSLRVSPPLLCTANARSLGDCLELIPPSPASCTAESDEVGVVCSGSGVDPSQPNILRLSDGTSLYNGVVEWRQTGGGWVPFTYTAWSNALSKVACHVLGFTNVSGAHYSVLRQRLSPSTCISSLNCSGSEGTFAECTGLGVNSHCTAEVALAGIQCAGPLETFTMATPPPPTSPSTPPTSNGGVSATAIAVGVVVGVLALFGVIVLSFIGIFVILNCKQGRWKKSIGIEKWYK